MCPADAAGRYQSGRFCCSMYCLMIDKGAPRQRRTMPRFKAKHWALPSLNYTLRGFGVDVGHIQGQAWVLSRDGV